MPIKKKRYVMVIDTRKCVGCMSCSISCKMENDVPFEEFRSWVDVIEIGEYPEVKRSFMPRQCNHCKDPFCVTICLMKANYMENGFVILNQKVCNGCGECITGCPYSARYLHKGLNVADKCTFCHHRVGRGLHPACVTNCMGKARLFGDMNDPVSEVSQYIKKNIPTFDMQEFKSNLKRGKGGAICYVHH